MPLFKTILLSLIWAVLSPSSVLAADDGDSGSDSAPIEEVQEDNNIMLRQIEPIAGYQPLTVAGQTIPATYLEETLGEPHGAIVLFHDQGETLENDIVTPLRHNLLQYGWSTLSLALDYPFTPNIILAISPETDASTASEATPPIENDASTASKTTPPTETDTSPTNEPDNKVEAKKDKVAPESLPPISNQQRIEAALAFLVAKDINRIIFLGHGAGGAVAINALDTISTPISALILVGTPALENDDVFKTFNQPILDIYGDQDLEGVAAAVHHRKIEMKRSDNIRYTSREIIGANHFFYGLEPLLTLTVRGWLRTNFVKQEDSE